MNLKDMWKANVVTRILLAVLGLMLSAISESNLPWAILGSLALIGGIYMSYRQGNSLGYEACGTRAMVEEVRADKNGGHAADQLDDKVLRRMWSKERGIKAALLSALPTYVINAIYIIIMLLGIEVLKLPARIVSWVVTLPYWCVIAQWQAEFTALTPAIVLVLMLSPFVLPAATYAGYLQGPKLWAKSEKAMKEGRRRAKAKSRVAKKKAPRVQKPEI